MGLFVKSISTGKLEVLCKVQCSIQIQRILACFHFCRLYASWHSALSHGGAIFLCWQHKAGDINALNLLQPLAQGPLFLHKRLWLIALLFSDQKCQNVSVKSRISWAVPRHLGLICEEEMEVDYVNVISQRKWVDWNMSSTMECWELTF